MLEKLTNFTEGVFLFITKPHWKDYSHFKEQNSSNFFFLVGSTILVFLFTLFSSSSITFLLSGEISKLHFVISGVATVVVNHFLAKRLFNKASIFYGFISILVFLNLFLYSFLFVGKFYDLSYDGQGYHQDAIIFLKNGWNPVFTRLTEEDTPDLPRWKWLNYYPKASEIIDATLYRLTDRIEYSKTFNFMFVAMAFAFVFSLLQKLRHVSLTNAIIVSFLVVTNPVNIYQSLNFYIDGRAYNLILSLISICGILYIKKSNLALIPFFVLIALLINIKTTALVYGALFLIGYFLFCFYTQRISLLFKSVLVSLLAVIWGLLILGANPYITNYFSYGNPLFPAIGRGSTDFVYVNAPENFQDKRGLSMLLYSIFSRTDNYRNGKGNAELKYPFTYNYKEVRKFADSDNTTGGFGVLFSGVFVLSILSLLIIFLFRDSFKVDPVLYLIGVVVVTVLINPAAYYSRFVPQLWLLPTITTAILLTNRFLIAKTLGFILTVIILLNNFLIAKEYFSYQFVKSHELRNELNQLATETQGKEVNVSFGVFRSNRIRFDEFNIKYLESNILECEKKIRLFKSIIEESRIEICEHNNIN